MTSCYFLIGYLPWALVLLLDVALCLQVILRNINLEAFQQHLRCQRFISTVSNFILLKTRFFKNQFYKFGLNSSLKNNEKIKRFSSIFCETIFCLCSIYIREPSILTKIPLTWLKDSLRLTEEYHEGFIKLYCSKS